MLFIKNYQKISEMLDKKTNYNFDLLLGKYLLININNTRIVKGIVFYESNEIIKLISIENNSNIIFAIVKKHIVHVKVVE